MKTTRVTTLLELMKAFFKDVPLVLEIEKLILSPYPIQINRIKQWSIWLGISC
ncbi:Uncharacterised protein [Bacillus freudenreichii]|nr:Uncharacterised protein [Bacillus freudenreichii]